MSLSKVGRKAGPLTGRPSLSHEGRAFNREAGSLAGRQGLSPIKVHQAGGFLSEVVLGTFTKLPLLQESRLTGGSPNLVDLVVWTVPVERKVGAANSFQPFYP